MDFSKLKKLSIGGTELKQLFINGVQVWKSGYKNWARYSTEADGKTIYNGGLGYKNGYRIRSGGAEGTSAQSSVTGYIPVKGGDIVRINGCDFLATSGTSNAINGFNASYTNIGQLVRNSTGYGIFASNADYNAYSFASIVEEAAGVYKWIVPPTASGVTYIRVTADANPNYMDGSKLIVTINEEIT